MTEPSYKNNSRKFGPYRFFLERSEDETGVSGVGRIADGALFADGTAVIRWRTQNKSTCVYASVQDVEAIHGHGGRTQVVWIDELPSESFSRGVADAYQDKCEGCMFASIGGSEPGISPHSPVPPHYVEPENSSDYLCGYFSQAADMGYTDG